MLKWNFEVVAAEKVRATREFDEWDVSQREMASSIVADESVIVQRRAWWRQTATTTHCCSVRRRVVMWVRCNTIVLATTAWLVSFCRRGRAVVVVACSAVECDYWGSQRPARDLHRLTTNEAYWRPCVNVRLYHWHLLHSPAHIQVFIRLRGSRTPHLASSSVPGGWRSACRWQRTTSAAICQWQILCRSTDSQQFRRH